MGLFRESLQLLVPRREVKTAVGAAIPTWQAGNPQYSTHSYERFARECYSKNELVYACVEELCTSASEPRLAAYRKGQPEPEKIDEHPVLDLFDHPNPFLSRYGLISGVVLHRSLSGNAYLEKVRSRAGRVVELWPLRPDRVKVIPHPARYISGYEYRIGDYTTVLDARDVIHIRSNHPLDDYYGMPPLAAAAQRVDVDNWMRQFVASFFLNAGVPAGLLNIKQQLDDSDREMLRERYRSMFSGQSGWHSLMVLDNVEAEYQQLGMPVGERGLAMPSLDEINEARIPMAFGVPLELIGARLGMVHGNRSTTKEARATFWMETLVPLYVEIAEAITMGLRDEAPDVDYFGFDYSDVEALQEDEDKRHERLREDMLAGGITREEFREAIGYEPEIDTSHTFMLKGGVAPMPALEPTRGEEEDLDDDDSPDFPELAASVSSNGRAH